MKTHQPDIGPAAIATESSCKNLSCKPDGPIATKARFARLIYLP
jgi:hypothetical protein